VRSLVLRPLLEQFGTMGGMISEKLHLSHNPLRRKGTRNYLKSYGLVMTCSAILRPSLMA
jgi:hypothetical protein